MEILVTPTYNFKFSSQPLNGSSISKAKASTDARTVTGFCSIFGNVDSVSDIVAVNAFRDEIQNFRSGKSRCVFLFGHDSQRPPIAEIIDLKVVARDDLPAVLRQTTDIAGALQITRRYFTDPFSDQVFQGVQSGAIKEMSFAFDVLDFSVKDIKGKKIRILEKLSLFDASDVLWGANPSTIANIGKRGPYVMKAPKRGAKPGASSDVRSNRQWLELQKRRIAVLQF